MAETKWTFSVKALDIKTYILDNYSSVLKPTPPPHPQNMAKYWTIDRVPLLQLQVRISILQFFLSDIRLYYIIISWQIQLLMQYHRFHKKEYLDQCLVLVFYNILQSYLHLSLSKSTKNILLTNYLVISEKNIRLIFNCKKH